MISAQMLVDKKGDFKLRLLSGAEAACMEAARKHNASAMAQKDNDVAAVEEEDTEEIMVPKETIRVLKAHIAYLETANKQLENASKQLENANKQLENTNKQLENANTQKDTTIVAQKDLIKQQEAVQEAMTKLCNRAPELQTKLEALQRKSDDLVNRDSMWRRHFSRGESSLLESAMTSTFGDARIPEEIKISFRVAGSAAKRSRSPSPGGGSTSTPANARETDNSRTRSPMRGAGARRVAQCSPHQRN